MKPKKELLWGLWVDPKLKTLNQDAMLGPERGSDECTMCHQLLQHPKALQEILVCGSPSLPLSLSLLSLSLSLYRHCRCTYSVPSVVNLHVVAIAISYCRCASQFFFGYSCNLLIPALCLAPSSAVTFNRVYLSHYVSIALCTYVLLFILLSVSLSLSFSLAVYRLGNKCRYISEDG